MAGSRSSGARARPATPRIDVLGPCRVVDADAVASSPSPVQRRILTRLAAAGGAVRAGVLAEAVWGERPPRTASAALLNQISRLRSRYGDDVLATNPNGYELGWGTDVDAVERAVLDAASSSGDDDGLTIARLDDVLSMWRGAEFTDIEHVVEIESVRRRTRELRVAAENLRLECALRLGRVAWAVPEAERLVGHSPYDEHRWMLLARALASAGRRGDALAVFDRARVALRDGLGLDPGTALREAELELLGAPAHVATSAAGECVGRDDVLETLTTAALEHRRCLVVGEEGAGASTVLRALARRLRGRALLVATASCTSTPATPLAVLTDLLEDLGASRQPVHGALESFRSAIKDAASRRPVVLIVDDLHLAGPSTLAVLDTVATDPCVALIASVDTASHGATTAGLGEWQQVELAPLDHAAVTRIVAGRRGTGGERDAELVSWLTSMSGGNPLFLECLLDELATDLDEATLAHPPAERLADVVRRRLGRLGAATRVAVEVTAVGGDGVHASVVRELAPATGIATAVAAGLLVRTSDDRLRFRHGAVGRVAYHDIPPGRRLELHHTLGRMLRTRPGAGDDVARHLLAAAELDPVAAIDAAHAAAGDASSQGAHRDAARWYQLAEDAAGLLGPSGRRLAILSAIGRGDALRLAGSPDHENVLFAVFERATSHGDPSLVVDAALAALRLGVTSESGHLHERGRDVAELALAAATNDADRARVAAAASLTYSMSGHPLRCRALFDEAERLATTAAARRDVLPFAYLSLGTPADLDRRVALGTELLDLGTHHGDRVSEFEARHLLFSASLQLADGRGAREHLAAMAGMIDLVGDVGRRWAVLYQMSAIAHLDDDLDAAERLSDDALAMFAPVSPSRALAAHGGQLLAIRHAQGRLAELAETFALLVAEQPAVPAWHAALALALVDVDADAARHHAAVALDDVPDDFLWLAAHVIGGRAAAATGDPATMSAYLERLRPWTGRACWQGTCSYGPVDLVLAELHERLGGHDAAIEHHARARTIARRLGAAVFERELDTMSRW